VVGTTSGSWGVTSSSSVRRGQKNLPNVAACGQDAGPHGRVAAASVPVGSC
jgi:hypothetical protein